MALFDIATHMNHVQWCYDDKSLSPEPPGMEVKIYSVMVGESGVPPAKANI